MEILFRDSFEINLESGDFWSFDTDGKDVTYYGTGGEFESQGNNDFVQLEGSCIAIIGRNDKSVLLFNPDGDVIFKLQCVKPIFREFVNLSRTEIMNEGFDYLYYQEFEDKYIIFYEKGLILVNASMDLLSEVTFEGTMVKPVIEHNKIIYQEFDQDIVYEVSNNGTINLTS